MQLKELDQILLSNSCHLRLKASAMIGLLPSCRLATSVNPTREYFVYQCYDKGVIAVFLRILYSIWLRCESFASSLHNLTNC